MTLLEDNICNDINKHGTLALLHQVARAVRTVIVAGSRFMVGTAHLKYNGIDMPDQRVKYAV